MGQIQGTPFQEFVESVPTFFSELFSEEPQTELENLTYNHLVKALGELNLLSKKCLDKNGKQLVFAIEKCVDDPTISWKSSVLIACVRFDPVTKKAETGRLLTLSEFLKVYKNLKCQSSAVEQSHSQLSMSTCFENLDETDPTTSRECCICLERTQEVILPCTHGYCENCIDAWHKIHKTCPICRDRLRNSEDSWIVYDVPKAEEISDEIRTLLAELTE